MSRTVLLLVRSTRSLLLATLALLAVAGVAAAVAPPGRIGPSLRATGNGRALHPVGRLTTLGNFPTGSALTRDGRFAWAVDSGHGSDDVRVVDLARGRVVQTLPLPGGYGGIAFAPDGRTAYVSGTAKGDSRTEGPTKGDGGDVVHVFAVDERTGRGAERDPIPLPQTTGGSGRQNSLPPVTAAFPEGLAVAPDGRSLVVALNQADSAAIIDLPSRRARAVRVGAYPAGVAFDRRGRAYVSNEQDGSLSVLDVRAGAITATIRGLGGALGDQGAHPEGMALDPRTGALYVAVANRDLIAQIDTGGGRVSRLISVARGGALGTEPVSLAVSPRGDTLYAADAGEDAVAAVALTPTPNEAVRRVLVRRTIPSIERYRTRARHASSARSRAALARRFLLGRVVLACGGASRAQERTYRRRVLRILGRRSPRGRRAALGRAIRALPRLRRCPSRIPDRLIGRLPVAAYPTDVKVTPGGDRLVWLAGKGFGAGPNPDFVFAGDKRSFGQVKTPYGSYVLDKLLGRAGVLDRPTDTQVRALTPAADRQARPSNAQRAPADTPVQAPNGGASTKIRHVFYIVRENRTYDQVFGSDPRGDGDPKLELFDDNGVAGPAGGITPNAHRLARAFPLLDHLYADSEVSVDGHVITAGAHAIDYVQKATAANYSNRGRAFDFGVFPVSFPPKAFVFDQLVRQSISFRDYGEQGAGNTPAGNDGRPTYPQVLAHTDQAYPGNLQIGCPAAGAGPANIAACTQDSGQLGTTGTPIAAASRFNVFRPQFEQQVATGTVPAFNYMILPNDHTNGTTANKYSPQALVADNDLALGQIVDTISHSAIWKDSAIFVVEDDSQDGADHVDAHRMPALVISPWARRGAVVHTRYDQYSALRTAELIVGLQPLSLNDALATPMYDAFGASADVEGTRFSAIQPTQKLNEVNGAKAPDAALSAALPFDHPDVVPQAVLDRILWHSVHGQSSTPPAPGPNSSPAEHERAVRALAAYRAHRSVRAALGGPAPRGER